MDKRQDEPPKTEQCIRKRPGSGLRALDMLVDEHEEEVSENGRPCAGRVFTYCPTCLLPAACLPAFMRLLRACAVTLKVRAIADFLALVLDGWTAESRE